MHLAIFFFMVTFYGYFLWLTKELMFDTIKISNISSFGGRTYVRTERCHNFIQQPVIQ